MILGLELFFECFCPRCRLKWFSYEKRKLNVEELNGPTTKAPNALGGQNYVGDLDAVFRWPETVVWTTRIFLYTTSCRRDECARTDTIRYILSELNDSHLRA